MIKTIDHIGIIVNDIQKSVDFYTGMLGFSIATKIELPEIGMSVAFIEKNGGKIELMERKGKKVPKRSEAAKPKLGENPIPVNDHISFSVENIESTVNELKEKGVVFDLEPIRLEEGVKLTYFKDPNGVLIELIEYIQ